MEHSLSQSAHSRTPFHHLPALDADQYSEPTITPSRALLPDLTAGDVSDSTEALNFLLTALQCPKGARAVIDATVGFVAGRSSRIEFYHFDLGRRMEEPVWYDDEEEKRKERERIERNVRNKMAALQDWIAKWNLPIRYTPGSRTPDDESIPSTLIFPLVDWAAEVVNTARQEPRFPVLSNAERANLFRRTAKAVLRRHKINVKPTDKARTKRKQDSSQILATIETLSGKYVAQICDEQKIEREAASDFLLRQLASRLPAKVWGVQVKTFRETDTETDVLAAKSYLEPFYPDIQVNICEKQEESHAGGAGSIERLPAGWEANQPEPERPAEAGSVPACDSLDCAEGEITEAEQLDELDGDAMTLLQAVLSVGGEVDQAFFKNDKEARGAGKGIDDEAKEPTTKITTERFSELLAGAIAKAGLMIRSFIARIRGPLLQIDDCDEHTVLCFEPVALFVAETSPQNFQVWLAFKDEEDKEAAAKRLFTGKNGALSGGLKGNRGSSGAIRWAGSRNFKRDGAPLVRLDSVQMGRITTPAELDDAGLLESPVAPVAVGALDAEPVRVSSSSWPDYNVALVKAERKPDSVEPDESNADSKWVTSCLTQYRKRRADVIAMLRQVSPHAREQEPESYAARTVDRVADYLQQKNGRVYA